MAKRFTATDKWGDPWFCGLSVSDRMFWIYLLDACDHAGIWQVNWPLVSFYHGKDFKFNESRYLQFRFEGFNFTNHPNWNPPATNPLSPSTFGRITSARTMREMQFGLKYVF